MGDLTTGFDSSFSSPSPPVGKFGSFGAPPQKEQGRILDTDIESGTVSLFMSQTLSSCPSLFGTQKPNDRKPFGTNWSGARPRSPGPRYHVKPGLVLTQQREPTPKFGDHPRFERAGVRFYNEACSKQTNYGIDSPGAIYKIQTDFSPLNLPPGNSATIARRQVSPLRRSARAKFEGAEGGRNWQNDLNGSFDSGNYQSQPNDFAPRCHRSSRKSTNEGGSSGLHANGTLTKSAWQTKSYNPLYPYTNGKTGFFSHGGASPISVTQGKFKQKNKRPVTR